MPSQPEVGRSWAHQDRQHFRPPHFPSCFVEKPAQQSRCDPLTTAAVRFARRLSCTSTTTPTIRPFDSGCRRLTLRLLPGPLSLRRLGHPAAAPLASSPRFDRCCWHHSAAAVRTVRCVSAGTLKRLITYRGGVSEVPSRCQPQHHDASGAQAEPQPQAVSHFSLLGSFQLWCGISRSHVSTLRLACSRLAAPIVFAEVNEWPRLPRARHAAATHDTCNWQWHAPQAVSV